MFRTAAFLLLVSAAFAVTLNLQLENLHNTDPYIFEDVINETIEGLRPDLPDPLTIEELVATLPNDGTFDGVASISNFELDGLQGFELTELSLNIIGFELNFTLILPEIKLTTDYDINLTIYEAVPVWGDGSITVDLVDLELQASTHINLTDGISINNLLLSINLGNTTYFKITGLFNDEDLSEILSDILDDIVVNLIDANHDLITQLLSPLIQDLINSVIGSLLTPTEAPTTEAPTAEHALREKIINKLYK